MITAVFVVCSLISVSLAYFLRGHFSGENLKVRHSAICLIYNAFFGFFYMDLAETNCILFYGCFPDFIAENPIIFWLALVSLILHASAFPENSKVKRWIFREEK